MFGHVANAIVICVSWNLVYVNSYFLDIGNEGRTLPSLVSLCTLHSGLSFGSLVCTWILTQVCMLDSWDWWDSCAVYGTSDLGW